MATLNTYYSVHPYTNEIKKETTGFALNDRHIKTLAQAKKELRRELDMALKATDIQIQELIERRNQLAKWAGLDNVQVGI